MLIDKDTSIALSVYGIAWLVSVAFVPNIVIFTGLPNQLLVLFVVFPALALFYRAKTSYVTAKELLILASGLFLFPVYATLGVVYYIANRNNDK